MRINFNNRINISIGQEVITTIKTKAGVYELSGLPDAGASSTSLAILDKVLDKGKIGAYITSIENPILVETAKTIARRHQDSIVFIAIDYADIKNFLERLAKYSKCIDYMVIDNFAQLVLNKYRSKITYLIDTLKKTAVANSLSIIIVNQLRYQVDPSTGTGSNELKPLYWEYLQPYLARRYLILKDKTNISVKVNESTAVAEASPFGLLEQILNSLEE